MKATQFCFVLSIRRVIFHVVPEYAQLCANGLAWLSHPSSWAATLSIREGRGARLSCGGLPDGGGRQHGQAGRGQCRAGGQVEASAPGAPRSAPSHGAHWTQSRGGLSCGLSCQSECKETGLGVRLQYGSLGSVGKSATRAEQGEGAVAQFRLCPGGSSLQRIQVLTPGQWAREVRTTLSSAGPEQRQPVSVLGRSGRRAGSPSGTVGSEWSRVGSWSGSSAPSQQTSTSMTRKHRHRPPTPSPHCPAQAGGGGKVL